MAGRGTAARLAVYPSSATSLPGFAQACLAHPAPLVSGPGRDATVWCWPTGRHPKVSYHDACDHGPATWMPGWLGRLHWLVRSGDLSRFFSRGQSAHCDLRCALLTIAGHRTKLDHLPGLQGNGKRGCRVVNSLPVSPGRDVRLVRALASRAGPWSTRWHISRSRHGSTPSRLPAPRSPAHPAALSPPGLATGAGCRAARHALTRRSAGCCGSGGGHPGEACPSLALSKRISPLSPGGTGLQVASRGCPR